MSEAAGVPRWALKSERVYRLWRDATRAAQAEPAEIVSPPQEPWSPDPEVTPNAAFLKQEADKLKADALNAMPEESERLNAAAEEALRKAKESEKAEHKALLLNRGREWTIEETKAYMLANRDKTVTEWAKATGRYRQQFSQVQELREMKERIQSMSDKDGLSNLDSI